MNTPKCSWPGVCSLPETVQFNFLFSRAYKLGNYTLFVFCRLKDYATFMSFFLEVCLPSAKKGSACVEKTFVSNCIVYRSFELSYITADKMFLILFLRNTLPVLLDYSRAFGSMLIMF